MYVLPTILEKSCLFKQTLISKSSFNSPGQASLQSTYVYLTILIFQDHSTLDEASQDNFNNQALSTAI